MTIHYVKSLNTAQIEHTLQRFIDNQMISDHYTQIQIDNYRDYFTACETGDMTLLRQFIERLGHAFEPYIQNEQGLNWVRLSAKNHHYALFEYLLFTYQLRLEQKDKRFLKGLVDASMFEAILQKYKRAKQMNRDLLVLIKKGDLDSVRTMVKEDTEQLININLIDLRNWRETPLMVACSCKNSQKAMNMVQYLLTSNELRQKAQLHARNFQGDNALSYAVIYGHLNIIEYLLTSTELTEHSNIFNEQDRSSALILATKQGRLEVVKYLVESFNKESIFNILDEDEHGYNALNYAFHSVEKAILYYFIIEHNIPVSKEYIEYCLQIPALYDVAQAIEARDLHAKLQRTLHANNEPTLRGKI